MGLAPSGNCENLGKSVVAKVPVPIFSQPRSVPTTWEGNRFVLRGRQASCCAVAKPRAAPPQRLGVVPGRPLEFR